jgi:glycosyltransferase involved in cell wall biosynthesis
VCVSVLSLAQRDELRRSFATAADDVVIVQVGQLEAWKGQQVLLAALATLRELSYWTCWIVGGAGRSSGEPYVRELQRIAREGGIANRIRFVGERSDLAAVLDAADIFCQPNVSPEPFGFAFIDALHAGLPVVTSDIGGSREIIDESCGLLTPPGDVHAVSSALRRLIVHRDLAVRLSKGARQRPAALAGPSRQMRGRASVLS